MGEQRRRAGIASRGSDLLSLGSFILLGLPDGMLGTAWPSMRATFGAPVGDLGLILLISTIGSVLVTAVVGPLIRRLGVPALLAVAGVLAAVGYAGFAAAPGLWLVLSVSVLLGISAGSMDAGLNTAVALTGRQRLLNLLHGAYGVGTAIGPLVVTAAILTGSWRPAYLVQVALDLVMAALWLRQRRRDRALAAAAGATAQAAEPVTPAPQPSDGWSRRRYTGVVIAGMSVFFVYTGLEVGAGQWEASFCRDHLHLSAGATGLAAFGYWGALTAVRIGLALRTVPPQAVVRWGSGIGVLACAVIWWQPGAAVTVAAFAVLGGALAGVFPALIALTPVRLGGPRAHNVISWQVGSAAAGGAGVSAIIGLLIGATSLAVLGPAITVLALILITAELILDRLAPVGAERSTLVKTRRSTFETDWAEWHRRHEELRAGPHGFLAITGRHWLTPEPQRFGDAPGAWSAADDRVTVTLDDGGELAVDGEPVHGTYRFAPIPERGQVSATSGDAVIEVARRGGHLIVRPRHPDHPLRTGYAGTPAYAPDPHWAIEGRYLPYDAPRDVTVGAVVEGLRHVYDAPGEIEFAVDGQTLRLTAFNGRTPGSLHVLFTDATSGVTTYPANRALEVAAPDPDGPGILAVILDFNRAVNLPCAYTEFATCPLPPAGNHLPVAVEAGEKLPREQHPAAGRVP